MKLNVPPGVTVTVCTVVDVDEQHKTVVIQTEHKGNVWCKEMPMRFCPESERVIGCCFKLCQREVETSNGLTINIWGETFSEEELHDPEWERLIKQMEEIAKGD